jgi:hypothetical protein
MKKVPALWYNLDLFLPIIKLGEADVWTPKDDRRWANLYRKVHIIIGSLFVPIGLAAWTGIIKLHCAIGGRPGTCDESKCATLDRQIDSLVYELYDLTPEEIAIVEGSP